MKTRFFGFTDEKLEHEYKCLKTDKLSFYTICAYLTFAKGSLLTKDEVIDGLSSYIDDGYRSFELYTDKELVEAAEQFARKLNVDRVGWHTVATFHRQ